MATRTGPSQEAQATPAAARRAGDPGAALTELSPAGSARKVVPVVIDLLTGSTAVAAGLWWSSTTGPLAGQAWLAILFVPAVVSLFAAQSIYRQRLNRRFIDEIAPVETNIALSAILVLSIMTLTNASSEAGTVVTRIWICAAVLMPAARLVHVTVQTRRHAHHRMMSPALIIGSGEIADRIIDRLHEFPEYGLQPVGILDGPPTRGEAEIQPGSHPDIPLLGSPDAIDSAISETQAQAVIIAFAQARDQVLTRVVTVAHRQQVRVWVVPRMFDVVGERALVEHVGGLPLLALRHADPHGWLFSVKHFTDRVAAALGLLAISPLFLGLMALVRLSSPGPIFFQQDRVGRDGKVFGCIKFRTMRPPKASDSSFDRVTNSAPGGVEGEDRRTRIGKIMRATSLDELPQLINVVKGEMSLVGPRPERPEFVELFKIQVHRYGERHRVKAGMTGWAQVHGLRGQTSIADRAEWDNYYIENWSLALDLKILALTVVAVLRGAPE
ncbi:sugar transferase [Mycolicibacterium sp. S3B2]|uniref:sugar transferase n=1 Tax=Mycolicibacterium sp. S3B2 TaxID=3415120 RepID=UPI003C7E9E01